MNEGDAMKADLSTSEAARLANVNPRVIRRAITTGELDAYSTSAIGYRATFRIPWKAFEKWREDKMSALRAGYNAKQQ